jgi:hypothetical protein
MMRFARALALLSWVLLGLLPRTADAAKIAFYFDPRYVSDDADLERQALSIALGHDVTTFAGTSGTQWQSALAGAELVVVPEQSDVLFLALDAAARTALHDYVFHGGGLLLNLGSSRARDLLNGIFGFSTSSAFDAGPYAATAATTGTPFAAIASLPAANSVISMQVASLPAGARVFYTAGTSAAAFGAKVGAGHVAFLGFDWAEEPPPAAWQSALDAAVEYVRRKTSPHAVSFFADASFVDMDEEGARLLAAVTSLGHTVTQFTGGTECAWRGALEGADVLVLPTARVAALGVDVEA